MILLEELNLLNEPKANEEKMVLSISEELSLPRLNSKVHDKFSITLTTQLLYIPVTSKIQLTSGLISIIPFTSLPNSK